MNLKSLLMVSCGVALALTANAKVWQVGDKVSAASGNYEVTGENLLPNPYFEDGFTDWTNGKGDELSADGKFELREEEGIFGKVLFGNGNTGSAGVGSVRSGIELVPGKTYLISYMEKNGGEWSRTMMASAVSTANDNNVIIPRNQNTADWSEKQAVVTVTEELPFVVFNFAWLNGANFAEFFVGEVSLTADVNYDILLEVIDNAKNVADEAKDKVGTANGDYDEESYNALLLAIELGEEAVAEEASQEDVNTAVDLINEALAGLHYVFNFEADVEYIFQMETGGRYLSYGWYNDNEFLVMRDELASASKIKFVQPEGVEDGYNMISENGQYAFCNGNWDTSYTTNPGTNVTNDKYLWKVENVAGHWVLKCVGRVYLAADNMWNWAPFYADKAASKDSAWFRIFNAQDDDTDAVEGVEVSARGEKVFYDLNGRRVNANSLVKGIYVVRQGGKASKVVVK